MFITPLTLEEFLVGQMISGVIKGTVASFMAATIVYLLSHFSILSLGWPLGFYIVDLIVFSWAIGMFVLSFIFRLGMNVQSLSWALVYLVQPFGGMFFSVSVLPYWVQKISWLLPSTYIFESIRQQLHGGAWNTNYILNATVLNLFYLVIGYFMLRQTIAWAKRSGAYARMNG